MKTTIIAEAGVNHNGDIAIAKKLIEIASQAGADYVKFQSFSAEKLVVKGAAKAKYQINSSDTYETQFEMLKKLELSEEDFRELVEFAKKIQMKVISTAFDIDHVLMLNSLGQDVFKIPSGEITNVPYLRSIGNLQKEVVLSSGMSTIPEIKNAIDILVKEGTSSSKITVLHCTSAYPAPYSDINLRAIKTIREQLNTEVGYSDHSLGIEVPIAAVALGASIIEKHFTLDKNMAGPDHKASLSPQELTQMILAIRNVENSLGSDEKRVTESERENMKVIRKSIVAKRSIRIGEIFSEENITTKRPGTGLSPLFWDQIIGKASDRDYEEDDLI